MALTIKNVWLDLILEGENTWEIRGTSTQRRGNTFTSLKAGLASCEGVLSSLIAGGWSIALLCSFSLVIACPM